MGMVDRIPKWVKQHARALGAFPALTVGSSVELTLASESPARPAIAKRFDRAEYWADPDECWRQVVAAHRQLYELN